MRIDKELYLLLLYFTIATSSLLSCGCNGIGCKKEADYTLTDYAKSWYSSYESQTVIFKNQFDSLASYAYSDPQTHIYDEYRTEGGCDGSVYATVQVSDMKLESEDLPYYFNFQLYPFSTNYHGSTYHETFYLAGDAYTNPIGANATAITIDLQNQGTDIIRGTFHDSVLLNNRVFYQAYSDTNLHFISFSDSVLSIYFTKQDGIVGFRTRTETWSLEN